MLLRGRLRLILRAVPFAQLIIQHETPELACSLVSYCTLGYILARLPLSTANARESAAAFKNPPTQCVCSRSARKKAVLRRKIYLRPMLSIDQLKAISGCNVTRTSKGLRPTAAPCTSISLPTEVLVHALEYTSIDDALVAFDVSKAFRPASRFALNKGRWAPVVQVVLKVKNFPWHRHGYGKEWADEVKEEFCAAWHAKEPWLLRQIMDEVRTYRCADMECLLGELLRVAEPALSDEALGRVVANLEHVDARHPGDTAPSFIFEHWFRRLPGVSQFLASKDDWVPRLFRAAEGCIDGYHAGNVLCGLLINILGYDDAAEFETETFARKMTAGWSDEHKRDELVAVFRGVQRDRAEELQEELGAIEREAWISDPTGWPG